MTIYYLQCTIDLQFYYFFRAKLSKNFFFYFFTFFTFFPFSQRFSLRGDFLAFLDEFLGESRVFRVGIFVQEAVTFVFRILITLQFLLLDAVLRQLELTLHQQERKILALVAVREVFQRVLRGDDAGQIVAFARLVAVAEIGSEVVIEPRRVQFLLHEFVLQGEEIFLGIFLPRSQRIDIEIFLQSRDCSDGSALVESRFGRTHIEALTDIEFRQFSIIATRIRRIIFLEILRSRLVVFAVILGHRQHIKTFLTVLRTLHQGYKTFEQRNRTGVLTRSVTLLGIFVFILVIVRLESLIELPRASREQERYAEKN